MSTTDPNDLAKAIELLANELFSGSFPVPQSVPTTPVAQPPVPSAAQVGAGGMSPAVTAPPVPGALVRPPIANAPVPKESDARNLPATLGVPTALIATPDPSGTPYFLQYAGGGVPIDAPMTTPTSPWERAPSALFPARVGLSADAESPSLGGMPATGTSGSIPGALDASPLAPSPSVGAAPASPPATAPVYEPAIQSELYPELVPSTEPRRDAFDAHAVKNDFPILRERVHGKPLVWLDNAATTQKPQMVIDRISYFYEHENSNIHRAAHALAARATDAYEDARKRSQTFLHAASPDEIIFVRGATEGINLIAKSWGNKNVRKGDEILVTHLEHHANIVPWQQLCSEKGACLRVAPVDDRGVLILEELEKLLSPKTRLVAIPQVSNALGTIVPAQTIVQMAHRHGAAVLVDGAQAVSHMPVDVQALDCEFYVFSGHKIFAPTGIGVVYGKRDVLEHMPPWQGGGNMIEDVTFERTRYQKPPMRFEAGTGNIADAVGLGAALEYVQRIGLENIDRYEHELRVHAEKEMSRIPGLRIIGTAPEKAGVISFILDGLRTEDVGRALDQEGIAVRAGHHCAQPILRRFGLESTVRASLAPYNTHEDIDALVNALFRLKSGQAGF